MANFECCNPDVLRCRAKVLEYIRVVDKLARPPKQQFPNKKDASDKNTPEGPWLLFDWNPDNRSSTCVYSPSLSKKPVLEKYRPATEANLPVTMTESGKRDDVTLCMMLACVCHYIPNPTDATADRPEYLGGQDGDAYSGEVGPTRGPGQNARFAREERDHAAQQWAWHTWKKNEEITYASDVVWLCRLVLEDCRLVSSDDNREGGNSLGMRQRCDKIKTAYRPVQILP
eukprot:5460925-Pyramimonas_sp.AAC.1